MDTLIVHCEDDKEALKEIAITLHGDMKILYYVTEGSGTEDIEGSRLQKVMNFL